MSLLKTTIKDAHAETRMFTGRIVFALVAALSLSGLLVARLVQLQVVDHEQYRALSVGNSLRLEPLAPTRGLIFDRNGQTLAENVPTWQLELTAEQVPDIDETLDRLVAEGFITEDDLPDARQNIRDAKRFTPVALRSRLSDEEVAHFAIRRPYFQGVDITARLIRHYPHGMLGVHAIGYVSGISVEDLRTLDDADNYAATRSYGKTGIEHQYEHLLHGQVGYHQRLTNARGRNLDVVPGVLPKPGENITLTLDIELQRVVEEQLDGRRGSVVAIDPRNGEILAMASTPAFDPNAFATGMRTSDFAALRDNLNRPLFNRAVRGRYPPGSLIKPILGLAMLETHTASMDHRVFCNGAFSLPNSSHRYRDWKPEGHGLVDLHDAITESCDVFFYEMSSALGIDTMHEYLTRFGLGSTTGIDIPGEKPGLVPSRAWKKANFKNREDQVWFPGETVIASIGQGYLLATPLQLATITAAIASRGQRFKPRLLLGVGENSQTTINPQVSEELAFVSLEEPLHWEAVVNSMRDVMHAPNGTAFATGNAGSFKMAGKSGTAQVFSVAQEDEYDEDELDERLRDHALFIAFAPLSDPRIAVAVIIENGSSGSRVAAPIAQTIMDAWLLRDSSEQALSHVH